MTKKEFSRIASVTLCISVLIFPIACTPGKIEEKPVVRDGEIVVRTILPLTGTFDHRIVDGAQIGKLARGIKRNFRKPEWLDEVPSAELAECIFRPAGQQHKS